MKNVAIMTPVDHWNLGNRLQNYAVQEVLRNIGVRPETIKKETTLFGYLKFLVMRYHIKKQPAFGLPFDRKFMQFSKYGLESHIPPDSYDYFIAGSDQVWNPNGWYNKHKKDKFLLSFAPAHKRVAFSASFGINKLPDEWKPWFQEQLSQFKSISVREDAGKKIVEELTDRSATVLIDPTCLFDKEKWDTISTPPQKINLKQPYILTYFLGGRSDSANKYIQECAEKYHFAVHHLADSHQKDLFTSVGPSEFLYLVSHAELVFTDSFHGCVFSFLYKKPFLVYARSGSNTSASMMSRLETLLKKFDLERKFVDSGLENDLFECNYETGFKQLKIEREKAINFLKDALDM